MKIHLRATALSMALSSACLLAACSSGGLSGTYSDPNHIWVLTFQPNGEVTLDNTMSSQEVKAHYTVDGDKVLLHANDNSPDTVLHRDAQGRLEMMGQLLTKKD